MGTTFAVLFLTVFFVFVMATWRSGITEALENPGEHLSYIPEERLARFVKDLGHFNARISGSTFYFPLAVGLVVSAGGTAFGYALYKEKAKESYALIWFGMVCSFTLVWMVTTIIFYVDLTGVAGGFGKKIQDELEAPFTMINSWGKKKAGTTAIALIVGPTIGFLFLSFVAYRLYIKLSIFGNQNPDIVGIATETKPGSWFDRQTGAEGGTWQREPDEATVAPPLLQANSMASNGGGEQSYERSGTVEEEKPPVVLQADNPGGALGTWLEDVFDYTF